MWRSAVILVTVTSIVSVDAIGYAFPRGRRQPCTNEGEKVELGFIEMNPCITCKCEKGLVTCDRDSCPEAEKCHLVLLGQRIRPDKCCERCKGCQTEQGTYEEGDEWTDPDDSCQVNHCASGVITRSQVKCHVPCSRPLPAEPGQCCPRCPECLLGGHVVQPGHNMTSPEDPCVTCTCGGDGRLECTRRICPALSCPASKTVHLAGDCCPRCKGVRRVPAQSGVCHMGKAAHRAGQNFTLDPCTECTCHGSTSVCRRLSCPDLACPRHLQVHRPGSCCAACRPPERVRRVCRHMRQTIEDGKTWKLNPCTVCNCSDGQISCEAEVCPSVDVTCPPGHHLAKVPGECCRQCVENDAVCTVFGDPHYSTFDGKLFNFQGTCKYLLAKDCVDKTFSVRVNNDPRNSQFFSWTRSATIKVGSLKVALRQDMKVKVDGEQVKLPYVKLGLVTIYPDPSDNYNVVVRLSAIGVSMTWDGDSFLQVKVPPSYKNKMCGLCGNYNGIKSDDLVTKRGRRTRSINKFGRSWRVGGRSSCAANSRRQARRRHRKRNRRPCGQNRTARAHAVRQCNRLKAPLFAACHPKVHPANFFRSCVQDMCECERGKACYCEAMTAYSHACRRQGVKVDWLQGTQCGADRRCATGAKYVACRSPCQPTCSHPHLSESTCPTRTCRPGCLCPAGTLLYRNACLPPQLCPNR